jgi:hypothetical protein
MKFRLPHYRPGEHLVVCDRCGFTLYSGEAKKTWDGLIVCPEDWEPRHPQDFVRGRKDQQSVEDARPYPDTVFLSANEVTPESL